VLAHALARLGDGGRQAQRKEPELRWEQFEELAAMACLSGGWTLHVGYCRNGHDHFEIYIPRAS